MIIKTTKIIHGVEYDYTYSDAGFLIERDGAQYEDAVDPLNSGRVYTETDIPINPDEEISDEEAFNILMGVDE